MNGGSGHSRKSKRKHTQDEFVNTPSQEDSLKQVRSYSTSNETPSDDGVSGWKVLFFLLLGFVIFRMFRGK